jgi:4-hydroxy-2-oxoheptanedioate aldolase
MREDTGRVRRGRWRGSRRKDSLVKINRTRELLLAGETAFGFELGLGSPFAAEALARSGIDFLQIDNQHGDWGQDSTLAALIALEGGTATPMARVARNDYTLIGRLLDNGCMGIVVPMVDTAADAKAAADATRFPPHGKRSAGWGRIGRTDREYWLWIDSQVLLMVQIESIEAVKNAEAILATPGVDGCWIGPSDLAFSMGIHPSTMHQNDDHARALERVREACINTGKIPGYAAFDVDEALVRQAQGFQYLTAGADYSFIIEGARASLGRLRPGQAEGSTGGPY